MKTSLDYNTIESLQQQPAWKEYIDSVVADSKVVFDDNLIVQNEDGTMSKNTDESADYAVLNYRKDFIPLTRTENISLAALMRILTIYGCKIKDTTYPVNVPHTFKIQGRYDGGMYGYNIRNKSYDHPAAQSSPTEQDGDAFIPNMSNNAFEEDTTFKYIYDIYGYNQKNPILSYAYVYKFEQFYELVNSGGGFFVRESDTFETNIYINDAIVKKRLIKNSEVPVYRFTETARSQEAITVRMERVETGMFRDSILEIKEEVNPSTGVRKQVDPVNAVSDPVYIIINERDKIDLQKSYYTTEGVKRPDYDSDDPYSDFSNVRAIYPIIRYNEVSMDGYIADDDVTEYELSYVEVNTDFSTIYKSKFVKTGVNPFDATQDVYEYIYHEGRSDAIKICYNFYKIAGVDGDFIIGDKIDETVLPLAMHAKKEQLFASDNYVKTQPLFVYDLNNGLRGVSEIANLDGATGGGVSSHIRFGSTSLTRQTVRV